jgi:hypothetical protein
MRGETFVNKSFPSRSLSKNLKNKKLLAPKFFGIPKGLFFKKVPLVGFGATPQLPRKNERKLF